MIFPRVDALPRHPSQIYQALLEGLVLFAVMFLASRRQWVRARFGMLSGMFLCGYALARIVGEFFRAAGRVPGLPRGSASPWGSLLSPADAAGWASS